MLWVQRDVNVFTQREYSMLTTSVYDWLEYTFNYTALHEGVNVKSYYEIQNSPSNLHRRW